MLKLRLKPGQRVRVADTYITVHVPHGVRLSFDGPDDVQRERPDESTPTQETEDAD